MSSLKKYFKWSTKSLNCGKIRQQQRQQQQQWLGVKSSFSHSLQTNKEIKFNQQWFLISLSYI